MCECVETDGDVAMCIIVYQFKVPPSADWWDGTR